MTFYVMRQCEMVRPFSEFIWEVILYDGPRKKTFRMMFCETAEDAIAVCRVLNGEAA